MFRFLVVTADGDSLGIRTFARPDFNRDDTIPLVPGEMLRVLDVLDAGELAERAGMPPRADDIPALVVERIAL